MAATDGDPGLFGPDSVTWQAHGDPMMWVAGIRALYLQALHPRAVRGVMQNSDFRRDAWGRPDAHRRLRRHHDVRHHRGRRAGRRPGAEDPPHARRHRPGDGERYGVDEPALLLWVHCAEIGSYLHVLRRSGFPLTDAHADRYLADHRARVAGVRARVLAAPDCHPDTLAARYETGVALGRLGRCAEALTVYEELVDDRARAQGPEHPETLRARHGLGVNLGRLGRWADALAEARGVCAVRERVLGPDHQDTLVSHREVAVALGWLGRWSPALTEYSLVTAARERVLGPGHPDTLVARDEEAHCLERLGRAAEAAELYRGVAALRGSAR
ncbi:hypothetical protein SVIOM342S_01909 [Streptomyces violaceorubidus]